MRCPVCAGELRLTNHQGIALGRCPGCEGAWLDRDGLTRILGRSRSGDRGTDTAVASAGTKPERWPGDVPFYDFG